MGDFFPLLTGSRLRLFRYVAESNQWRSATELAEATGLKIGTVRLAVRSMVQVGLLNRERGPVAHSGRQPDLFFVREPVRKWWAATKDTFSGDSRGAK